MFRVYGAAARRRALSDVARVHGQYLGGKLLDQPRLLDASFAAKSLPLNNDFPLHSGRLNCCHLFHSQTRMRWRADDRHILRCSSCAQTPFCCEPHHRQEVLHQETMRSRLPAGRLLCSQGRWPLSKCLISKYIANTKQRFPYPFRTTPLLPPVSFANADAVASS